MKTKHAKLSFSLFGYFFYFKINFYGSIEKDREYKLSKDGKRLERI